MWMSTASGVRVYEPVTRQECNDFRGTLKAKRARARERSKASAAAQTKFMHRMG